MNTPTDNEILVVPCDPSRGRLGRFSVDDFDDPNEFEITSEEIHLTAFLADSCEGIFGNIRVPHAILCFKFSTTSARELVRQLNEAIARREGGAA